MLLAIGCGAPQTVINAAAAQGAKVITLPAYPRLGAPVSSHADLLIHPLGGALYTFGDYYRSFAEEEINRICDGAGLELRFIGADAGSVYPADVPLCAKRVGDFFLVSRATAPELCDAAAGLGLHVITTKQGYTACSADAAGCGIITSDTGIACAASKAGIPRLVISPGSIDLPGYGYGFIGGSCAFCAERGEVWFTGDPMTHPDGESIAAFIRSCGALPRALTPGRLYDCGGMFFFQ